MEERVDKGVVYVTELTMRKTTWRERLRKKLFPTKLCQRPGSPGEYADYIHLGVLIKLTLWSRFRTLVTGRIMVEMSVGTENEIGKYASNTVSYVGTKRDDRRVRDEPKRSDDDIRRHM